MPRHITSSSIIKAEGNKAKVIEEFIGRINSQTEVVSIARMKSPEGWIEAGQTPEFDEYTVVLKGMLRVETKSTAIEVHSGEAIIVQRGEWIKYSTPNNEGAEYIAVCVPAFSPETVHRDKQLNYEILRAGPDDAEELLKVQRLAYQSEAARYGNYDIPPLKQTLNEIMEQFNTHVFLKATCGRRIIGTVRAFEESGTCNVARLAVHPDMQDKGIGTALMNEIEKYYKTNRFELFAGSKSNKEYISLSEAGL